MKKITKYSMYFLLIIVAIFCLNTSMNLLVYNLMINNFFESVAKGIDFEFLLPIVIVLHVFFISFVFSSVIVKFENKDIVVDEEGVKNKNRKERIIISSIYGLSFIIYNVIFYFKYLKNMNVMIETIFNYNIQEVIYSFISDITPKVNVSLIVLNCLVIIPSIILINLIPKKDEKKLKFFKGLKVVGVCIFSLIMLLYNVYFWVDIPEFKYAYELYKTDVYKNGKQEEVFEILGYSDYMRNFEEKIIIPNKVWNKGVYFRGVHPSDDIYFSGSISWETVKDIMQNEIFHIDNNYILLGESEEWFIENNQFYNQNKTEMLIRGIKEMEYLHIPSTIEKIFSPFSIMGFDKDVVVDDDNRYFYSCNGNLCLYLSEAKRIGQNINQNINQKKVERLKNMIVCISNRKSKELRIQDDFSGEIFIISSPEKENVIIPSSFTNYIYIIGTYKNLIVEEGNQVYSVVDNHLYNKDITQLIIFNPQENEIYKIPNSVKEINANALFEIAKSNKLSIELDENNENFIYEDGTLYNKEKTKIICTKIHVNIYPNEGESHYYIQDIDKNIEIDDKFKQVCEMYDIEIKYKK